MLVTDLKPQIHGSEELPPATELLGRGRILDILHPAAETSKEQRCEDALLFLVLLLLTCQVTIYLDSAIQ